MEKQLQEKKDSDPIMTGILEEVTHLSNTRNPVNSFLAVMLKNGCDLAFPLTITTAFIAQSLLFVLLS